MRRVFNGGESLYIRINEIENFCKETKLLELVAFFRIRPFYFLHMMQDNSSLKIFLIFKYSSTRSSWKLRSESCSFHNIFIFTE